MQKDYGKLPKCLGPCAFDLTEVMHFLYLPVRLEYDGPILLPANLSVCHTMINRCIARVSPNRYRYVYLSARKGWATPDNPLNRPGWHCDGFGTDDLNFVWWTGPGTRFAHQFFDDISDDHVRSMEQFEEQLLEKMVENNLPEKHIYELDPAVVHATPLIRDPGCWRQYVKVSLSNQRYNLANNSHNYLFHYDWPLHERELVRNDPARAQADHVEAQ